MKTAPPVVHFKARIVQHPDLRKAVFAIPGTVQKKLGGLETLEGIINGHPFRASLEDDPADGQFVRVNAAMLKGGRVKVGDTVELRVLGPEPTLAIAPDIRSAFNAEAKALFSSLPDLAQRDWIRWIDGAKTPETRARRITRTVEQLSEGKRRPCCVNFYEYMLMRVRE